MPGPAKPLTRNATAQSSAALGRTAGVRTRGAAGLAATHPPAPAVMASEGRATPPRSGSGRPTPSPPGSGRCESSPEGGAQSGSRPGAGGSPAPGPAASAPARAAPGTALPRTSDDDSVDLRSAGAMGFFEDPLLRYVVREPQRRSPVVNWFTHIRRAALRDAATAWIAAQGSGARPQIAAICRGWDTLGPLVAAELQGKVQWADVDDPTLTDSKAATLATAVGEKLPALEPQIKGASPRAELVCKGYAAVGCISIRQAVRGTRGHCNEAADALAPALDRAGLRCGNPTLVIGPGSLLREGSVVGERLQRWCASLSVLLIDELSAPDPFARLSGATRQRDTSIPPPRKRIDCQGAESFGGAQIKRAGLCRKLAQVLSDPAERSRLRAREKFDAWEDLWEACRHFALLAAATRGCPPPLPPPTGQPVALPLQPPPVGCADELRLLRKLPQCFTGWGHAAAAVTTVWAPETLFIFYGSTDGGMTASSKVICYDCQSFRASSAAPAISGDSPEPRLYPQVATMGPKLLLFGGRNAQGAALAGTYVLNCDTMSWSRVSTDGPAPRWRHSMCGFHGSGAVLFGGITESCGAPLGDTWVWTQTSVQGNGRWERGAEGPAARHSCTLTELPGRGCVVLHGGMSSGGSALGDTWLYGLRGRVWEEVRTAGPPPRFSHSACCLPTGQSMLVLGGEEEECASDGVPRAALLELPEDHAGAAVWRSIRVKGNGIGGRDASAGDGGVLLARHDLVCIDTARGIFACVGGGSQCLGHGTFLSQPRLCVLGDGSQLSPSISATDRSPRLSPREAEAPAVAFDQAFARCSGPLETVQVTSEKQWADLYAARRPFVATAAPIGKCVAEWTPDYLIARMGGKQVSVGHSDDPRMTFVPRNYEFETMRFSELIERTIAAHPRARGQGHYYFRSVGMNMRKEASDFWHSFPEIADDFHLPPFMKPTVDEKGGPFSSVMRVASREIVMWLHFDVMDNALFQVCGSKKVILFPPSCAPDLYLEGSSSVAGDITSCDESVYPRVARALQRAVYCELSPGDMLFIPALWCHTTCAAESGISLNVFWRHLAPEHYDSKDLYGNKDLLSAQRAEEHLAKLQAALDELPDEYREFYTRICVSRLQAQLLPMDDRSQSPENTRSLSATQPVRPSQSRYVDPQPQSGVPRLYAGSLANVPPLSTNNILGTSGVMSTSGMISKSDS
eukprot:TRINITY_DN6732_c0_g1_i3.p1 TRINITY_DN6732_c0_g1~~TRINITY_DN6732_c0_g1_i3.p1  ORF type:complete len:1197 (+),score=270.13 TRINITY_DN6732_c0_g1_i3:78-3668(+)